MSNKLKLFACTISCALLLFNCNISATGDQTPERRTLAAAAAAAGQVEHRDAAGRKVLGKAGQDSGFNLVISSAKDITKGLTVAWGSKQVYETYSSMFYSSKDGYLGKPFYDFVSRVNESGFSQELRREYKIENLSTGAFSFRINQSIRVVFNLTEDNTITISKGHDHYKNLPKGKKPAAASTAGRKYKRR